jgi:hypothetical protein
MTDHTFATEISARGRQEISKITMSELYQIIGERLQYYSSGYSDPDAFCQNVCCEVEKAMGIYPNVPKITEDDGA